jgi:plasmid stabilization system protein ParE
MRIAWWEGARADVRAEHAYLLVRNRRAGAAWRKRVLGAVGLLRRSPELGRVLPERGDPAYRELIVGYHIVLYAIRPERVEVIGVFDGRQDREVVLRDVLARRPIPRR